MKQKAARICLAITFTFLITGWLAHCHCPGWFGMGIGFAAASFSMGSSKVRGVALFALIFSIAATVAGLKAKVQQRYRFVQFQQGFDPIPSRAPDEEATGFTSNLPIIVLHANGRYISKEQDRLIRAEFHDLENGRASLKTTNAFEGWISIHLRGSTTARLPKQSFTFHTMSDKTNQTKVSFFGFPKEEDWILYAPFEDKTMIRDVLAYELTRKMGRYAPRSKYVEVFITNSKDKVSKRDYAGVYVLMEKIKRGSERVNIAKLTPEQSSEPDISGGYIIKRDHDDRNESRFHTSRGGPYFYVYPNPKEITPAQRTWLKNYFTRFENALYGEDFTNTQNGYAAYLDVDAFIDAHWLVELSKNVDGFRYSAFITKDRGGKLKVGPPWDWNRSFGNANYYGGGKVEGWYSSNLRPREISWYHRLREDPAFMQRCSSRWVELRKDVLETKKVHAMIDEIAGQLQEAQRRNFERWPILGEHVTCNYYVGDTYEEEVRWMKKWIQGRLAWIDRQVAAQKENGAGDDVGNQSQ